MNDRNTLREKIYRIIRSKILTDEYAQGQKLSENTLAQEYGCSRTPIREILTWLKNDGLVVVVPKSGSYVRTESKKDLQELIQCRAYLESLAYRLVIELETHVAFARMSAIHDEMDDIIDHAPIDLLKLASLHYEFHFQLIQASESGLLKKMYERLNLRSSHMFYRYMDEEAGRFTQSEHAQILEYLEESNPAGERFVREHLLRRI